MDTKRKEKGSSITRVLEIIEAVSLAQRPLSPADLCVQLGIPKPSLHRLINQLCSDGFLQLEPRGLLLPGVRLHKLTLGVLNSNKQKTLRHSILDNLAKQVGETCGIAIVDAGQMLYLDRVQSDWPLQINLAVGTKVPLWCTSTGKLYLSFLPQESRATLIENLDLVQMARNTITDKKCLETDLANIKQQQLGYDNEEFIDGMVACSVPICDQKGELIACLFTHAPVIRKSYQQLLEAEPALRQAALKLAKILAPT